MSGDLKELDTIIRAATELATSLGVLIFCRKMSEGRTIYIDNFQRKTGKKGAGAEVLRFLMTSCDEAKIDLTLRSPTTNQKLADYYGQFGFVFYGPEKTESGKTFEYRGMVRASRSASLTKELQDGPA
jgi:hypothetical protein